MQEAVQLGAQYCIVLIMWLMSRCLSGSQYHDDKLPDGLANCTAFAMLNMRQMLLLQLKALYQPQLRLPSDRIGGPDMRRWSDIAQDEACSPEVKCHLSYPLIFERVGFAQLIQVCDSPSTGSCCWPIWQGSLPLRNPQMPSTQLCTGLTSWQQLAMVISRSA